MDPEPSAVLLLLLLWCVLGLVVWVDRRRTIKGRAPRTAVPRVLRPRTPDDCVLCQAHAAGFLRPRPCTPPPRPWREGTRRRGAPRRVATQGYACPTPECAYYGITDSFMHALVGVVPLDAVGNSPTSRAIICYPDASSPRRSGAGKECVWTPDRCCMVFVVQHSVYCFRCSSLDDLLDIIPIVPALF
jgi:hypothetical protein